MSPPELSVVVVSYNTCDLTRRCLESIREHGASIPHEVIVVDNASGDGTPDMVRARFPDVHLIANPDNRGFAAGNNQAFQVAQGRYVLLLNPDTEVREDALRKVLGFARTRPDAGVIGCRVRYPDGTQQSTTFRYLRLSALVVNLFVPNRLLRQSRWLGRSRYIGMDLDRDQEVEVVAGCFMLVPKRVLDEVGGMDEGFWMYGEEADWCYRIRRAGWSVVYTPAATVLHHGGQSARQRPDRMVRAMARSQLRFLTKTQGGAAAWLANLLMLARDLPRALAFWGLAPFATPTAERFRALLRPSVARLGLHARGLLGAGLDGSR